MPPPNLDKTGLFVAARTIPIPRTITTEAQAFLSNPPIFAQGPVPDVDDKAGWRVHVEQSNRGLKSFAAMRAEQYPADIVTYALSAAPLYVLTPKCLSPRNETRAILYIHGGGFTMGAGPAAAHAALPIASLMQTRTFSIDYRMPPDHPFPAGLDDAVEAYQRVLAQYRPENIAVYGPSAGGGLAAAFLLKARDIGLPMPAACVLHSPEADLTESGDTFETNDTIDIVLKHRLTNSILLYADGHDLKDPYLSPVFGDFRKGFPPTILTSGTRDLFLSNTVILHRALRRAGVKAELHVWEAMPHGGFFGSAPEDDELQAEQIRFMDVHMGRD